MSIPASLLPYLLGEEKDYSTLQPSLIRVNIIFIVAIILTSGLRFVVRFHMLRSAGVDDIFMVLALIFALLLSTSCLIGESFGLGKHLWNLSTDLEDLPYDVGRVTKALYGCYLAYSTSITFTKLSIMATYIRIFPTGLLRYIVYGCGIVVVSFWISSIFAIIFTCYPVQAAWDYTITNARCIHILDYFYIAAGVNIATDLLLCFLPVTTIWSLTMPRTQRVVVCVLFSMGTFACVASILRLTQLRHLTGVDVSYQTVGSLNWSVIEVGTAIICTSISALRPLATRLLPGLFAPFTQTANDITGTRLTGSEWKVTKDLTSISKSVADGNIDTRQSFDAVELEEMPKHQLCVPESTRSKTSDKTSWAGDDSFKGSSQDDLVAVDVINDTRDAT